MEKDSRNLMVGAIIIMGFLVLSALLGYSQKVLFAKTLSISEIGLFFSVLSFITFFVFFRDMGICDSFPYFIPAFLVAKNKKNIKSLITLTLYVELGISVLFLILLSFFSKSLSISYFKDPRAKLMILFLAVYFLLDSFSEVLYRSFQAYKNMFLYQATEFTFQALNLIFFSIILFFKANVVYFGLAYVLSSILVIFIFFTIFIKKLFPDFFRVKSKITKKFAKKVFDYSIPTMTGNLAVQVFSQQTIFFLTFFLGLESVGLYVMATSLGKIASYFFKAVAEVFVPMISEFWNKKDLIKLNYYFNEISILSYVIGLPISLAIMFFSKEALRILYGENFVIASNLLILSCVYYLIQILTVLIKRVLLYTGLPKIARNNTYIMLVTNLTFNLLLIPKFGVIGAGIADLISIVFALIHAIHTNGIFIKIKIPYSELFKLLLTSMIYVLSILFLKSVINLPVLIEMGVIIITSGIIYLILLFIFKIIDLKKLNMVLKEITKDKLKIPFLT